MVVERGRQHVANACRTLLTAVAALKPQAIGGASRFSGVTDALELDGDAVASARNRRRRQQAEQLDAGSWPCRPASAESVLLGRRLWCA